MRGRRRSVLALTLVLVLVASPGFAFWGDAHYILWQISQVLQTIANVKMAIQDALQWKIKHLYQMVYPGTSDAFDGIIGVFRDIDLAGREFTTFREQLEKLSCDWNFSVRTLSLQSSLFAPVKFCKPSFKVIYGTSRGYWDSDMEELHDAISSFTLNTISESIEAEDGSWDRIFPDIEQQTKKVLKSPGWANRQEAVALAGADLMAVQQGKLRLARFIREATDAEYERFLEKKEKDFALSLLLGLNGATLPDAAANWGTGEVSR